MRVLLSFRSVWYDVEHFPSSWKLDPTEGPDRVRCRLQRFHLDVEEKYLMKEYCGKSEKVFFIGVFIGTFPPLLLFRLVGPLCY